MKFKNTLAAEKVADNYRRMYDDTVKERNEAKQVIIAMLKRLGIWENYIRTDIFSWSAVDLLNLAQLKTDLELDAIQATTPGRLGPLAMSTAAERAEKGDNRDA